MEIYHVPCVCGNECCLEQYSKQHPFYTCEYCIITVASIYASYDPCTCKNAQALPFGLEIPAMNTFGMVRRATMMH